MNVMTMHRKYKVPAALIGVFFFLISCAKVERKPLSYLDTSEHHTYTGIKLMNQGKYSDAEREFDMALQLNPKFSRAYGGGGLVSAYKGDFDEAFDLMEKAEKYAKDQDEKTFAYVGNIRLYTMSKKKKDWLKRAEEQFDKAVALDPKSSAAYFFMGIAYKYGLEFTKAGESFARVLDLNEDYLEQANDEWRLVQKIQRAMPGTQTGKKIALVERLTRADTAALFMEELKLDELFERRSHKIVETPVTPATDVGNHVLKSDIEGILKIGVRGLEIFPDGAFHPDDLITRAAFAMMIEDIIIKITGDDNLSRKFVGAVSPFYDLKSDHPSFNAVMVVTTRGIMRAKDPTTGVFSPLGAVSGADALLIIRELRDELRYF